MKKYFVKELTTKALNEAQFAILQVSFICYFITCFYIFIYFLVMRPEAAVVPLGGAFYL